MPHKHIRHTWNLTVAVLISALTIIGALALLGVSENISAHTDTSPASQTTGSIRYVALEGDDIDNDCTVSALPCRTIQHAIDQAAAGDEVRVAGGVYTHVTTRTASASFSDSTVTQIAFITKSLTLRGGFTTTDWLTPHPISYASTLNPQSQGRGIFTYGDQVSITIDGLHITQGAGSLGGGVYAEVASSTWKNNILTGNHDMAVFLFSGQTTMLNNTVANTTTFSMGIWIIDALRATLQDNIISHNSDTGLKIVGTNHVTLTKNTFEDNQYSGVRLSEITNAHLISNTFAQNESYNGGGLVVDTVETITLTNNEFTENHANDYGGGLYIRDDVQSLNLYSNTFTLNTSQDGGAIYSGLYQIPDINLTGNIIQNNAATSRGGGLFLSTHNGIFRHNRIIANTARNCGGGWIYGEPLTLTDNLVSENVASYIFGGLELWSEDTVLDRNTVISNVSTIGLGGGIVLESGTHNLTNNVIANNTGSGIFFVSGNANLWHNTISGNSRGIDIYDSTRHTTIALTNTILTDHTVGITVPDNVTLTVDSVLWHNTPITISSSPTATASITQEFWGDPDFVDPTNGDFHIGTASTARDAGSATHVTSDIDGETRPAGAASDLGADEFYGPDLHVTKRATPTLVTAGKQLTYTLCVTNTGSVPLHTTIIDTLPAQITLDETAGGTIVLPGGQLVWQTTLPIAGNTWSKTFVVTVTPDYSGTLTNHIAVTTREGVTVTASITTTAHLSEKENVIIYLPLILRNR